MLNNEKFKVVDLIRKLIISIYQELTNFPKKDLELKKRIIDNSYDILELSYRANTISDIYAKKLNIEEILGKIKVLDFLLNLSYEQTLISSKKYLKLSLKIGDIQKYSIGWLNLVNNEIKKQEIKK